MAIIFKHIVVEQELEMSSEEFFLIDLLFVTVGFVYSRLRSTVTDARYRQIHLTRRFPHAHCTRLIMLITPHGSSVCTRASFHLHAIHDERLRVCSSLFLRSDLLWMSRCQHLTLRPEEWRFLKHRQTNIVKHTNSHICSTQPWWSVCVRAKGVDEGHLRRPAGERA